MDRTKATVAAVTLLLPLLLAAGPEKERSEPASDGLCDRCGSCDGVTKVCVPQMTEREIKKVCWGFRCEDFCIPGPSVRCGIARGKDDCGCWWHELWKPTCAEIRTKRVPVKTEVKRMVPAVQWTVEERCRCCRSFSSTACPCE